MKKYEKPKVLVSSCILGNNVRFDGGHLRDNWVVDILGKYVDFIPVCPEMLMGLGSPRETLKIVSNDEGLKLMGNKSGENYTDRIKQTSKGIITGIKDIHGIILANKSPSCGVRTAKIYDEKSSRQLRKGNGFFTDELIESGLQLPLIDSGLINDNYLREVFVRQLFCYFDFTNTSRDTKSIQNFHKQYKYLLMEHSAVDLKSLGQIAANETKSESAWDEYHLLLKAVLFLKKPSKKKRLNVIYHLLGYFKKDLVGEQKKKVLGSIADYENEVCSYASIIELFSYLCTTYNKEYLNEQILFSPYPKELKLLRTIDH